MPMIGLAVASVAMIAGIARADLQPVPSQHG